MKRFFLFMLLVAVCGAPFVSKAQLLQKYKRDKSYTPGAFGLTNLPSFDTTGHEMPPVIQKEALEQSQPVYSHTTPQGKVYIMQPDHMSCLVPDMKRVIAMPGIKPVPEERMPNPYYKSKRPRAGRR